MKKVLIIGMTHDVLALQTAINIMQHQEVCIIVDAEQIKFERSSYKEPTKVFQITAYQEIENCFFEEQTNKPKWFQGTETSKFKVNGKKKFTKYNSRKKTRNNKHK